MWAIRSWPKAAVRSATEAQLILPKMTADSATAWPMGDHWILVTELQNTSTTPALMVHLKAVRGKSGDRILPALYDDNYLTLMPGETRRIHTELEQADSRGENPRIAIDGFNVEAALGR